jgi:hypothetical protein
MTILDSTRTLSTADAVERYLSAWNETDGTVRRQKIADVWTVDGSLTDPPMAVSGHDGIDTMIGALQHQFPGHRCRRSSAIDAHHRVMRFEWELVAPDGVVAVTGLDVVEFTDDGRFLRVSGFFGSLAGRDGAEPGR